MQDPRQEPFLWTRWLRAGLVAGLWACGAFVALLAAVALLAEGGSLAGYARELLWAGLLYLAASIPLALLLSLIGHRLLHALGWRHPAAFVLAGAMLGTLAGIVITIGTNPGALILGCGVAGAAAGWGYHRVYLG